MSRPAFQNVRFCIHHNGGPVKLTLRPGQIVEFFGGGPHEEGHSWNATRYEYSREESALICDYAEWGRDCDGPHEFDSRSYWPLGGETRPYRDYDHSDEFGEPLERPELRCPEWQREAEFRRDQFAESAGY